MRFIFQEHLKSIVIEKLGVKSNLQLVDKYVSKYYNKYSFDLWLWFEALWLNVAIVIISKFSIWLFIIHVCLDYTRMSQNNYIKSMRPRLRTVGRGQSMKITSNNVSTRSISPGSGGCLRRPWVWPTYSFSCRIGKW